MVFGLSWWCCSRRDVVHRVQDVCVEIDRELQVADEYIERLQRRLEELHVKVFDDEVCDDMNKAIIASIDLGPKRAGLVSEDRQDGPMPAVESTPPPRRRDWRLRSPEPLAQDHDVPAPVPAGAADYQIALMEPETDPKEFQLAVMSPAVAPQSTFSPERRTLCKAFGNCSCSGPCGQAAGAPVMKRRRLRLGLDQVFEEPPVDWLPMAEIPWRDERCRTNAYNRQFDIRAWMKTPISKIRAAVNSLHEKHNKERRAAQRQERPNAQHGQPAIEGGAQQLAITGGQLAIQGRRQLAIEGRRPLEG